MEATGATEATCPALRVAAGATRLSGLAWGEEFEDLREAKVGTRAMWVDATTDIILVFIYLCAGINYAEEDEDEDEPAGDPTRAYPDAPAGALRKGRP